MTDTQQGVTVNAVNQAGRREVENHPTGELISVSDGHLIVQGPTPRGLNNLAIYAPGKWISATVHEG